MTSRLGAGRGIRTQAYPMATRVTRRNFLYRSAAALAGAVVGTAIGNELYETEEQLAKAPTVYLKVEPKDTLTDYAKGEGFEGLLNWWKRTRYVQRTIDENPDKISGTGEIKAGVTIKGLDVNRDGKVGSKK